MDIIKVPEMKILMIVVSFLFLTEGMAQKSIEARITNTPPRIDGFLSPGEWSQADSAVGFTQLEPAKGQPASEPTVVYVLIDESHIYLGFKCMDITPSSIVANVSRRDNLEKSDDAVFVILDSYHDNRSGFVFQMNPIGTQTDLRVVDDGRETDINWDTQWRGAARKTDFGWTAEMAIPFSGISYNNTLDTWGINFGRIIRKNFETAYWSGNLSNDFRISQGGELTGLSFLEKETLLTLTPYSTFRHEDSDVTGNHDRGFLDFGGDASYHITTSLIANLTINPDFATVEGDQEEINLTRWELEFPEKRLFFLEGNELYDTRIQTFYSRRAGDIDYGGKVVGKMGDYTISAIAVKSPEDTSLNSPYSTFSTLRLKRDILESSTLGFTFVNKGWQNGSTRSLSADYVLNLGETWKLTGQFVASAPGDFWKSTAYFLRFATETNIYHFHVRYSDTGENFKENVNQTGFINDDDMQEVDSDLEYTFWLDQSFIKYIAMEAKNNIFWNHQGTLRSWNLTPACKIYLRNRFSLELGYNNEFKLDEKEYYNHIYNFEFGYNTDEWASADIELNWGRNYDRDFFLAGAKVQTRLFEKLALGYKLNHLTYDPDPESDNTIINILSVDYNFTRDLWFRLLAQNNSGESRFYIYGLFGWRFQPPFGALYLIYTTDDIHASWSDTKQKNQILFLKFSYQFNF